MKHKKKNIALWWAAFLMTGNHLFATELPNSKILGALPQSFDNIGIVRYIDMDPDTVVGSEFRREVPAATPAPTHALPLSTYIAQRLRMDGLSIAAVAFSNQDVAASTGNTGRNNFMLYVADHNTSDLMRSISSRRDVQQVSHALYDVYRDNNPTNPTYVAFLGESLILMTGNENDIAESGPALLAQDTQPAPNWSALNAVDTNAPVLILRHLQFPMVPPPDVEIPHHEDFVLGMWISDMSAPIFQIEASTDLELDTAEDYIRTVGAIEAMSGPDGTAFTLEPPAANNDNYRGRLEVLRNELGDHYTDLTYTWMLGFWYVI